MHKDQARNNINTIQSRLDQINHRRIREANEEYVKNREIIDIVNEEIDYIQAVK